MRTGDVKSLPGFDTIQREADADTIQRKADAARESGGVFLEGAEPSRPKKRQRKAFASECARTPNVGGESHAAGAESSSDSSDSNPTALEILTEVAASVGRKIGIVLQVFL